MFGPFSIDRDGGGPIAGAVVTDAPLSPVIGAVVASAGGNEKTPGERTLTGGLILNHLAAQLTEGWNQLLWDRVAQTLAAGTPVVPRPPRPDTKPRQRQTRLTQDQISELVVDYQGGMSVAAVSKKYRVDLKTTTRHLAINGIVIRQNKVGTPKDRLEYALALRAQGWGWKRIGSYFGCSHTAARGAILKSIEDPAANA